MRDDKVLLLRGDCLERMKGIPDGSVDMVLCDPPYGVTQSKWDYVIDLERMWEQYDRIVKPNGAVVLFAQMPFTAELVMSNRKDFKYMWIWDKTVNRGFLNAKKQPLRRTENIAVFYRKQCTYNPHMRKGKMQNKTAGTSSECYGEFRRVPQKNDMYYPTDILTFKVTAERGLHPNRKPVPLLEYLVETYTNPGETVLDNCMGSGSTGEACVRLGRRFIGIEKEEKYFEIAEKRIGDCLAETQSRKE